MTAAPPRKPTQLWSLWALSAFVLVGQVLHWLEDLGEIFKNWPHGGSITMALKGFPHSTVKDESVPPINLGGGRGNILLCLLWFRDMKKDSKLCGVWLESSVPSSFTGEMWVQDAEQHCSLMSQLLWVALIHPGTWRKVLPDEEESRGGL